VKTSNHTPEPLWKGTNAVDTSCWPHNSTLNMEGIMASEKLVSNHQATWRNNPENHDFNFTTMKTSSHTKFSMLIDRKVIREA
jgi:hypothetical protein